MLKLKGQTESGEWVEFQVDDIIDTFDGEVKISLDRNVWVISDTIQPAEPCQHLISLMAGLEIPGPEFWYNRHPHDLELVGAEIANQAKSVIQPADDPRRLECPFCGKSWTGFKYIPDDQRKDVLNETKYKIEHLEAGPPVELYRKGYYSAVVEILQIIDEMEAKL